MGAIVVSLVWGLAAWRVLAARPRGTGTTLTTAGRWAVGATAAWTLAWMGELWTVATGRAPAPAVTDSLWHVAAATALCPAIAVLGARRPGVRVWNWFVLWPLVAVLCWPVAVGWLQSGGLSIPRIPLPLLLGWALVLAMGAGNYAATRHALSAALYGLAICCVAAPLSESAPRLEIDPRTLRSAGTLALALAVLWSERQSLRPTVALLPLERVWFDFRDLFGLVWAARLMQRVNDRAAVEDWPLRLTESGWVGVPGAPSEAAGAPAENVALAAMLGADPRPEQALRWLLRRFVDPAWIDARTAPWDGSPPVR